MGGSVVGVAIRQSTYWHYDRTSLAARAHAHYNQRGSKNINEETKRDTRPTKVGSVIVAGHIDRLESDAGMKNLDEDRAKAVKNYLVSKGVDSKLIFWEGKDDREPVPVTKFCE